MFRPLAQSGLLVLLLASVGGRLEAKPPAVLIFGGGWGPDGTQVSIEAHVMALADVLAPAGPEVLFAGPDAKARSVQVIAERPDEVGEFLALIFGEGTGVGVDYRPPTRAASGPATESKLIEALTQRAEHVQGTVVFGVGHGQLLGEEDQQESGLALWGSRDALSLSRFAEAIDRVRWKGPLAMVLGQCHSGGFARLAFAGAKPRRGLARPTRCVLAAVPEDRPASGCTSDLDDASARAFMAIIAEAFSRASEADLDKDRAVSLAEAFTYARIHDQTVNVPVRSSELYLRGAVSAPKSIPKRKVLLSSAPIEERAVLQSVVTEGEFEDVKAQFDALMDRRRQGGDRLDELIRRSDEARATVQEILFSEWPELTSRLHATSRRLLSLDAREIRAFLEGRPELEALRNARAAETQQEAELEALERQSARLERWIRAAENVAYERSLKGRPGDRRHLAALRACEALSPLPGRRP